MAITLSNIKKYIRLQENVDDLKEILALSAEKIASTSDLNLQEQYLLISNFAFPDNADVITKLANLYYNKNDLPKSLSLAKKAVYLTNETNVQCLMNAAIIAADSDQRDYAKEKYLKVLEIDSENKKAKFGLGIEHFKDKNYKMAWEFYLNRHEAFDTTKNEPALVDGLERWNGQEDAPVYLYNEQGYGDFIFSLRYLHNIASNKIDFSILLDKNMASLIKTTEYKNKINKKLKFAKYKCSVLDLPAIYNDDGFHQEEYSQLFIQHKKTKRKRPKIGITFSGGSTYAADSRRSIHLCFLKEILSDKRYDFFILQKDYENSQFFDRSCTTKSYPAKLNNFAITAECLRKLDAIITIDSSVAHLAGALGLPTFLLLEKTPDFRWYPFEHKTSWYQSWFLNKQKTRCDWSSAVIAAKRKMDQYFNQLQGQNN